MKTWKRKLQENYSTFEEWESWSQPYGLAGRLGFESEQAAWDANPMIGGSTNPADFGLVETEEIKERLEYLRGELRGERISYGELSELQSLAKHIEADDVELLEAAGVPEFVEIKPADDWKAEHEAREDAGEDCDLRDLIADVQQNVMDYYKREHRTLIHALKLFVKQYEGNGHDEREQRPEMQAARAALAKAEGVEP